MNKLDYDVDCLEISDDLISMAEDNTLGDFSHIDDDLQFTVKNDGSFLVFKKNNDNVKQSRSANSVRGVQRSSDCNGDTNLNRKQQRDDRRRANHNEIERRRRDKINNWIHELNKIIPAEHMNSPSSETQNKQNNGGQGENLSKGGILAKACEYITRLKDTSDKLTECLAEKDQILLENLQLKESINQLLAENKRLQTQLQFALETNVKLES
ncbi:upstream stimulatory factor 1-like isoform X4 [Anopheles arabiensis]|uniref:upstream stimulatory factor 1-like isoform X4 n=1 Tax=Anopheles arabiensis TaxID=7173 RepID=UPI001AACF1F6|nr:upstream stimulatory factor 1-like isoform X4 [Anopheles arabiensis]XP_040224943.1 upstream stimulatory factor 1-like isoform X4 [Anopheles coluzzii]XP_041761139.1 upstream stimulatory factor 1-like isoform X3 [Anopheles merus]XP_061508311.1 upstream stimulatory factor 1 isoform X3 [Anopheles gambiae]